MSGKRLTPEELDRLGAELDALRQRVVDDLGQADRDYLLTVVRTQRALEVAGRGLLFLGFFPPAWLAGVAALSASKILDNMEIGHNVMHGQYDWMRDPALNSRTFEWDTVAPAANWKHSHNYVHHTFTNVLGKDRDIGYGILRIDPEQRWHPYYLGNPVYAFLLMVFFQWGVMLHDLEVERLVSGEKRWAETAGVRRLMWRKGLRQAVKDYVLFPALSGPLFVSTLAGNATANLARNVWAFAIIFCGHFPSGVASFTEEETAGESRGRWYHRQLLGSANITGSALFHVLTGNLSHQIEHHLFPDLPARRYPMIAPQVRDICARYGLPYNTGGLARQLGSVVGKLVRYALPDRWWGGTSGPTRGTVGSGRGPRAA
ncbi:fatty acid desaturase family protein [Actinokineospora diospyrosa]|uniref:Fatty acid desaturase n=1 Tax=Actinokineospora diospyrosa TaxID=103728 RepID=A0ABT1IBA3_9PSEU|nr:acyl-CoA desaturase [Actinokineospora diospyrosa]MCP2269839.1 Fatty acid desaturase [Actinokineospora diospyrosa]